MKLLKAHERWEITGRRGKFVVLERHATELRAVRELVRGRGNSVAIGCEFDEIVE
jgi:hypothetical protein